MWVICEIPHSDGRRHQGINFKLLLYRSAAALSNLEIMPLNWQLSIENCTRITNTSKSIYIICHVFGDVASELPDRKELIKIISTRYLLISLITRIYLVDMILINHFRSGQGIADALITKKLIPQ
jgi:hypothetical protein